MAEPLANPGKNPMDLFVLIMTEHSVLRQFNKSGIDLILKTYLGKHGDGPFVSKKHGDGPFVSI